MRGIAAGDRKLETSDIHPDWTTAYGQFGNYYLVAASAVGHLHLYKKTPRDDAFALRSEGRWLAVAVADGVGSRPLSRYGASCAVEALCRHLLLGIQPESAAANFNYEPPEQGNPFGMETVRADSGNLGRQALQQAPPEPESQPPIALTKQEARSDFDNETNEPGSLESGAAFTAPTGSVAEASDDNKQVDEPPIDMDTVAATNTDLAAEQAQKQEVAAESVPGTPAPALPALSGVQPPTDNEKEPETEAPYGGNILQKAEAWFKQRIPGHKSSDRSNQTGDPPPRGFGKDDWPEEAEADTERQRADPTPFTAGRETAATEPESFLTETGEVKALAADAEVSQSAVPAQYTVRSEEEGDTAYGTLSWNRIGQVTGPTLPEPADYSLTEMTMVRALRRTSEELLNYVTACHVANPREFSCTLMGMLLDTETGAMVVGHIGDGLIAGLEANRMSKLVEPRIPPGGQGTYVFTDPRWERCGVYGCFAETDANQFRTLFLMTDGVAEDVQAPDEILQQWGTAIDAKMRESETLLSQKSIGLLRYLMKKKKSGNADDRTLVMIMRK